MGIVAGAIVLQGHADATPSLKGLAEELAAPPVLITSQLADKWRSDL